MQQFSSEDARRNFRLILNDVERGEQVEITRYGKPLAALVPIEWAERARAALGEPPLDIKGDER